MTISLVSLTQRSLRYYAVDLL